MRSLHVCVLVLLATVVIFALGCQRDVGNVAIEIVPHQGCAPLRVELRGTAVVAEGLTPTYVWTIDNDVHLEGAMVTHTFAQPGTYTIVLTVAGGEDQATHTTTFIVQQAALPTSAGLYVRQACTYSAIDVIAENKSVKDLGSTSLEDLEKRIVGRPLSTAELLTHPLWRRTHTQTIYTMPRNQFVDLPLERFHAFGVLAVGEDIQDVLLLRLIPTPEANSVTQTRIVTRIVDSWGIDTVEPERLDLKRIPLEAHAVQFMPTGTLEPGLYLIDVKSQVEEITGLRAVDLTAPAD